MQKKEYKYDAFISYRHCDLDKFVAENLHKTLETYELPNNIKEKLNIEGRTFKRLFRDQDELPLSSNLEDPILDALNNSKYLIVICSPRLKDSLWCKKEIQTFKKLRGRRNIFCVLIEGEPDESFPEEVLFEEVEEKGKKVKKPVEPLAADVRGTTKKEVLKKIHEEKLRLAAAMYNIDYDDLKQRHKLREQKRKMNILMGISIASILFLLYTSIMLIKINSQQKILKNHQAITLASKSNDYLKKDKRYDAIKSSYQALTRFKGVKMPYTSNAEYALVESLGVYDVGSSYKVVSEIKTDGVADYVRTSEDNKYAAVYDESEKITLFNTKTLKVVDVYDVSKVYSDEHTFTFIGNDIFSYINNEGNINLINIKDNKVIKEIKKENDSYTTVKGDPNGNYLVYSNYDNLYIYNVKDKKITNSITSDDDIVKSIYYSADSNYIFVGTSKDNFDINSEDYITMNVIDTKNGNLVNSFEVNASYIYGVITVDNNAYMLFSKSIGANYDSIVVSYDYVNGNINYSKTYENRWAKFITRSYDENRKNIVVVTHDTVNIFDRESGEDITYYNLNSEIINIYSYMNKELYLVFLSNGHVNYINPDYKDAIEYKGQFVFNLNNYSKVVQSEKGFLLIPKNENRVVLYEAKSNKNIKEVNVKIDNNKTDNLYSKYDELKEKYNIKNKSLVSKMIYDDKKELLFVNYINKDISIYNVKSKKLLKELKNVGTIDTYYGKDKNNRIYIGDISDSYILDNNYNKVGHVKSLVKVEKDKLIISNESKYYSVKIYSLNDLLKEAKEYLK